MRDWLKRLLMGLGIATLAATSALAQSTSVVTHDSWWLPPQAGPEAAKIDTMFDVIFVVTVGIMIAVFAVLVMFLVKYRYRPERRATFIHGHHQAEVIWTVTPAVILLIMGILSIRAWGQLRMDKPGPETPATDIEVLAQQFQWNFRYPGKDGRFGTKDDVGTFDANDTTKSPMVGVFNVPVNKVVRIHLMSRDVLHSFFLPNMRMKLDAVPGLRGELWFTPTHVGHYDLACAELCGPQHYTMRGEMIVLPQEDYDKWLKEREEEVASQIGEEPAQETPAQEEPAKPEPAKAPPKPEAKEQPVKEGSSAQPKITESAEDGVIKGKISFGGTAPKPRIVNASVDAHCKKEHPQGIELQSVKVKDGGLADVFVQIKSGLPKDKKWDVPTESVVLAQQGCEYHPHIIGVMAGQGIKVVNNDPTQHNIHGMPKLNQQFNFSQAQKGMEKVVDLSKPENFAIKCDVHNWMGAHAFVMSHPFFATSDEEGNFQIKNVPPGTYEIELWHETLGTQTIPGLKIQAGKGIQTEVKFAPKSGGR